MVHGVDVWEDNLQNLRSMITYVESKGRAGFPHLVTVSPHPPETEYTVSRIVARVLRERP